MAGTRVPRERVDAARERIEAEFEDADCPGMSVAVTDGDEILFEQGFGYRVVDDELPATVDTLYPVGSVSKPITALATLLLDEWGRINIDAPVSNYCPYYGDAPGDPVTVHQLLSHTSRFPIDDLAFYGTELDGWDDFREFIDESVDRRRTDEDHWIYYNSGYAVLSRLVELVTETEFPRFVEREIFDPLGMHRSTYDSAVIGDAEADVCTPYVVEDGEVTEATLSDNPVFESPLLNGPGGALTTVRELATFLQAHIGDTDLLPDGQIERMRTPVGTVDRLVDGTEIGYGYGLESRPFGSDTLIGHSGNTGASSGYAGFLEDRRIGIAVASNATTELQSIAYATLAALTGQDLEAVDPVASIERTVTELTGRYESSTGTHHASVRRCESGLEIDAGGGVDSFEIQLAPVDLGSDRHQFSDVDRLESTTDVEFFTSGERVEFLFEGLLFTRVDREVPDMPGDGNGSEADCGN